MATVMRQTAQADQSAARGAAQRPHHRPLQHRLLRRERRPLQAHAAARRCTRCDSRGFCRRFRVRGILAHRTIPTKRSAQYCKEQFEQFARRRTEAAGRDVGRFRAPHEVHLGRFQRYVSTSTRPQRRASKRTMRSSGRRATASFISRRRRQFSRKSSNSIKAAGTGFADATQAGWTRIIVEKPFGTDLESARALQQTVERSFASRRSIESTTIWAKSPFKTSWRCALPTRFSSQFGIGISCSRCRSRPQNSSASSCAAATTTMPARCAT